MNREIKFRAWEKVGKVLHSAEAVKKHFYLDEIIDDIRFTPIQYTDLKDKNGVEIYEGDCVSLIVFEDNAEYTGEVVWARGGFCIEVGVQGHKYKVPFTSFKDDEVILQILGNIYENPELLEVPQ